MARCTRYAPHTKCENRREAQERGEFVYSPHAHGWVLAYRRKPIGPAPFYRFTWCPWCGGALPDEVDAVERALYEEPEDGC